MVTWRYQVVTLGGGGCDVSFSFCHVCLDADGKLASWSNDVEYSPRGRCVSELTADVARLLVDAYRWKPVAFHALRFGMKFERGISEEQVGALQAILDDMRINYLT